MFASFIKDSEISRSAIADCIEHFAAKLQSLQGKHYSATQEPIASLMFSMGGHVINIVDTQVVTF